MQLSKLESKAPTLSIAQVPHSPEKISPRTLEKQPLKNAVFNTSSTTLNIANSGDDAHMSPRYSTKSANATANQDGKEGRSPRHGLDAGTEHFSAIPEFNNEQKLNITGGRENF